MADAHSTTAVASVSKGDGAGVLAEKDTAQPRETLEPVFGPVEDELFGKRIRKSFGSRAFWGTVVDAYVVGNGLFYKVSFDDGDVDIFSVEEVKVDMKAALAYTTEDPVANEPEAEDSAQAEEPASPEKTDSYTDLMRSKKASLKRRRDGSSSDAANDPPYNPLAPWNVKLWSVRLFATIMEEKGYIRIQSFVPMADGEKGELESSGTIQPGDALLAVQGRVVHGVMDHIQACDLIRALPRPLTLTFIRPPSSGERLTIAGAINIVKEAAQEQPQDQNGSDKPVESASKKARNNEETTAAATAKPPLTGSAASSPETRRDTPNRSNSRPQTPDFEIVQVVQPVAPAFAPPQQSHQQPSPYFARGMPIGARHGMPKHQFGIRTQLSPQQMEPIPYRQPSPHQRQPSPQPPSGVQRAPPQVRGRAYPRAMPYSGQNPVHLSQYDTAHYTSRSQQPPPAYTSAQMAHVPPTSARPTFYISQPAPSSHYPQVAPASNPNYGVMASGGNTYAASGGQPTRGRPMGSASGYQHSMDMQASQSQSRSAMTSRDLSGHRSGSGAGAGAGSSPFYQQSSVTYAAPRIAFETPPAPPQQRQQAVQRAVPSPAPAAVTQSTSERPQEKPSSAAQTAPAMTLGELVANLTQRQRQRAANAQRVAGSMAPAQATGVQQTTASTATNGGSAAPSPDKQESSSSTKSASAASSVEKAGTHSLQSLVDFEANDEFGGTGTSFLSLADTNVANDIPVTRKPNAAAANKGGNAVRPHRPSYLNKYAIDEVVDVRITQPRLHLTLGVMGDHVAVSTFVRGQDGQMGEIEASGKVLTGDILVGVGSYEFTRETSPTDVARIVGVLQRPYYAFFMRPSWDMLE